MAKDNSNVIQMVKPSQLVQAIERMMEVNARAAERGTDRRALFIWGSPGLGKSSVIRQVCKKHGMKCVTAHLAQFEPTDLRGIPIPEKLANGMTVVKWAAPSFLPQEGDPPTILFLDELPNAAPDIQKAAYQLVLDGQIGEYKLPNNCFVVAAGNKDTDKGMTYKMATPLLNRFSHLELRVDFDEWMDYAMHNALNPIVMGYLKAFPNMLFSFDPNTATSDKAFATPRSWEALSDILNTMTDTPDDVLRALMVGTVGTGPGMAIYTFYKKSMILPDPEKIIKGEITKLNIKSNDPDKIQYSYALMTALTYKIKSMHDDIQEKITLATKSSEVKELENKLTEYLDNYFYFMITELQHELCIVGIRTVLTVYDLKVNPPALPKSWPPFKDKFKEILIGCV